MGVQSVLLVSNMVMVLWKFTVQQNTPDNKVRCQGCKNQSLFIIAISFGVGKNVQALNNIGLMCFKGFRHLLIGE